MSSFEKMMAISLAQYSSELVKECDIDSLEHLRAIFLVCNPYIVLHKQIRVSSCSVHYVFLVSFDPCFFLVVVQVKSTVAEKHRHYHSR